MIFYPLALHYGLARAIPHINSTTKEFCSPDHVGVVDAKNMVYGRVLVN
jgi:hypothetical protein